MVSSVADILSGLWAKSSITVIPFAVPTTSSRRRMPLNSLKIGRGVCQRHAAGLCGAERGERVGNIVQPWNVELYRDDFTAVARGHGKRDSGRRGDRRRGEKISLGLRQAVGQSLARLQIGQQRRGFLVIEIQHHRFRLGDEIPE